MNEWTDKWNDMITQDEQDWKEMFQVQQAEKPFQLNVEVGECGGNCQEAKEIKCVCRCGGKNHGAALKQHVRSLDDFTTSVTATETYDRVDTTSNVEEYAEELVLA
jgi:hypothetical protein